MATIDPKFAERSTPTLQGEIARIAVVESRTFPRYAAAATAQENGQLSDSDFADLVERDVLLPFRKAEQRFSARLTQLRADDQPAGRIVQQYLEHQARCWQLRIESIREDDPAKALQGDEQQELANELKKQIWGTGQ